jgi:restriction endonuclease Mrr
MTTGSFTETATQEISASGIVLVSGLQLSQFLAVNRVGVAERNGAPHFDTSDFAEWIEIQRLQVIV